MNNLNVLEVTDLSFSWPGSSNLLFGPLSVSFERGLITALLGPNGVGKTTLLNVLGYRLKPTAGKVLLNGESLSIDEFNYMIQSSDRQLFPHLTLRQNIDIQQRSHHITANKNDLMNLLFMNDHILEQYPTRCSGGQRQRAVLCRTILDIPYFPVTMLDEPFAQISQDIKPKIYTYLQDIVHKFKAIMLVVTHDISEALILSHRVIVVHDGKVKLFDVSEITNIASFLNASHLRDAIQKAMFLENGICYPQSIEKGINEA